MAPNFSVVISVIDHANPPNSIGWTNAENSGQLAYVFFNEGARLSDLHVFILYVNLVPQNSLLTEQTLLVRLQSMGGLHYMALPRGGVSVIGREYCKVELKARAVVNLCCKQQGNNVEVYLNVVMRASIPCPFRLSQVPGWPSSALSLKNRVLALNMCEQRPHVELLPVATAG